MTDVLDQDEVNALLEAVEGGKIDVGVEEEVVPPEEVYPYDFKRPERVSKDQMRAFETLHEVFSRSLSAALSGYLRTIIEVKLVSVEQLTYSEFILSLPNPTCFNLLTAKPLEGEMILELNPSIVYPIVDRLLGGGSNQTTVPDRPLTEIEWEIISRITRLILEQLSRAWANIKPLKFELSRKESNPQLMQIVAPNEPVVLVCFELTMGSASGLVNLCVPFMAIDPVIGDFTAQAWFAYSRSKPSTQRVQTIAQGIANAELEVAGFLAGSRITLRELMELAPGDVIQTPSRASGEILLSVEGRAKFWGKPGLVRNHKAFRITRPADSGDHM
ncbi:MAG: flagellar motor switch protein FliM [Planctomycetes bacterium]|nr:flagellar motor switch protein FliM [Planctomycetota bacterium]